MSIIVWIVLGALAGWLASLLAGTDSQQGAFANIVVGIIGAFLGGLIMQLFGQSGVTGFNLYSIFVAVAGAVLFLWFYKAVRSR